jgi:uncharacterized protein DUF6491
MSGLRWRNAAVSLATAAIAACATGASSPTSDPCVFRVNLNDFTVLDDSTLIVYGPLHKDAYLVKLFAPITSLTFRQSLGFESMENNGQLCRGDYVVARGDLPQRMPISSLRALTDAEAKQLIAASKHPEAAKPPAAGKPPAAAAPDTMPK